VCWQYARVVQKGHPWCHSLCIWYVLLSDGKMKQYWSIDASSFALNGPSFALNGPPFALNGRKLTRARKKGCECDACMNISTHEPHTDKMPTIPTDKNGAYLQCPPWTPEWIEARGRILAWVEFRVSGRRLKYSLRHPRKTEWGNSCQLLSGLIVF